MTELNRKRVLVAVDGSEQAFEAVRYVSRFFMPDRVDVVLFHVTMRVPESFWDLEKEPAYHYRIVNIEEWEAAQERAIREFMDQARDLLSAGGVPSEAIRIELRERVEGIARDIVTESQKGYDAVVVGRRGLSELKDMVLGSIANRLVEKLLHVPVWIIGGSPEARRILIALDSSEAAVQVIEHVASLVATAPDIDVTLFHAVRGVGVFQQMFGKAFSKQQQDKAWMDGARQEMQKAADSIEPVFDEAARVLRSAGLSAGSIHRKVVTGVGSRAGAIVEEAQRTNCDTIVLGRRGITKVQEFFIGRVSNKVIQMAREKAVWVVS